MHYVHLKPIINVKGGREKTDLLSCDRTVFLLSREPLAEPVWLKETSVATE